MKQLVLIFILTLVITKSKSEMLIFKDCKNDNYTFEKNEYILNLDTGLMTREFIYTEDSYKKLRLSDINVKKKNVTNKAIAEENNLIVSEISGYPAFYTQMIFDKDNSTIKIRTVLNNTEGESLVAKCENIINYKKES